jgi:hypothetical protein
MPYLLIENFANGLESRKSPITAPPGSLLRLTNAAISPGGEIEKRRAFVKVSDLPTNTFGLAATENTLHVFTRNTPPIIGMSSGVPGVYLNAIQLPNASPVLQQTDYDVFDGRIYFVGYDPGTPAMTVPHYYANVMAAPPQGGQLAVVTEGNNRGFYVRTYAGKIYAVLGKNLYYSAIDNPLNWTTGTGAGFTNLALQDSDSQQLTSLEIYYEKMAIFGSSATQLWTVDPDPLQNVYEQLLRGAGTTAPQSALQYGAGDVLFLTPSGIRSLKARDSSSSAAVSDIGSPIDRLLFDLRQTQGEGYYNAATSILEPYVGRFWLAFPHHIYVLSYFPGPKITAWSLYTTPFPINHIVTCRDRIFIRSGNDLYAYGGVGGSDFDNCGVEVRLPYLDMKKPGHMKMFEAIDATVTGTWLINNSFDFTNPDAEEVVATISQPTWNTGRIEFSGHASHFSLRLYNNDNQRATLANLAIHYKLSQDED